MRNEFGDARLDFLAVKMPDEHDRLHAHREKMPHDIAARPRPALPDDLRRADDAIRRASSAVALPHAGLGLVLLLLGFQVAPALGDSVVAVGISLALLVGAIVQWRRSPVWVVSAQPGTDFQPSPVQP
jgi:hypothetical protein